VLPVSILPVTAKRKRQNGLLRLDILPCGMRRCASRRVSACTQDRIRQSGLACLPSMR